VDMKKPSKNIELLSPAGSLEKAQYAFHYGADAVYCGTPDFSLRVRINSFTKNDLAEVVSYAHKLKPVRSGKKVYITLNIYAHNKHLEKVVDYLKFLKKIKIDAVIVSDPGILVLVKKYLPKIEIHLSTQANATNWQSVKFWAEQGIKRIILAREVTLSEIKEIKKKNPKVELEYFVHGAMCMSYSGRCILSKWINDRSANLGDCSQPCRWGYKIRNPKSEIRNDFLEMEVGDNLDRFGIKLEEDQHGTYFFNSYDLNLLAHLEKLKKAGVDSFKIEGRAKSAYYVAVATRAYRQVLDNLGNKKILKNQQEELQKLTNRGYTQGFIFGRDPEHNFSGENFGDKFKFVGEVKGVKNKLSIVKVHNEINLSDKLEVISLKGNQKVKIKKIFNHKMEEVKSAHGGHANDYFIQFDKTLEEKDLLRILK